MQNGEAIKAIMKQRYGKLAAGTGGCCGSAGDRGEPNRACGVGYSPQDLTSLDPSVVSIGLGCGNPVALAELRAGEAVLDLGSGGGIDVFLAARRVGPSGKAIGIDMTEEMVERARHAAAAMGIANAEFHRGDIEALPLPRASVDIVISNCVINLAPDKLQVFREAFRVLKPGGRLVVSDVVSNGPIPPSVRTDPEAWARCIGGAMEEREYLDLLQAAGFRDVEILSRHGQAGAGEVYSISVRARKPISPPSLVEESLGAETPVISPRERALIAVAVARAVGSEMDVRSHTEEARRFGWSDEAIQNALNIADRTTEMRRALS